MQTALIELYHLTADKEYFNTHKVPPPKVWSLQITDQKTEA